MEFIELSDEDFTQNHICCAISDKKCATGYKNKKTWLSSQFTKGYKFYKGDVRGKVFIEYVPIEHSWLPLSGDNFMVINCFWVSGKFKGQGSGKTLLNKCLFDAKNMDGVVAVSSDKKRPFMSNPKFLEYCGFEIIDEAAPFFKLWGLKTNPHSNYPQFLDSARSGKCPDDEGITAYYSDSCPFTDYYTNQLLRKYAKEKNIPLKIHHLRTQTDGRNMPIPWILNSVFYKGELVTLKMKAQKHLDRLIEA
jgi:GNAT superfamily N-acetyltransferase